MTLLQLIQLAVVPAALIVLAGLLIRRRELGDQRFLLFLLVVAVALLLASFVAYRLTPAGVSRPGFMVAALLSPVAPGVLVLILLHLKDLSQMRAGARALALGLGLACLALLSGLWGQPWGEGALLLPGALLLALVWTLGRRSERLATALGLAVLALLLPSNLLDAGAFDQPLGQLAPWLRQALGLVLWALPVVAISLAAVLLSAGLEAGLGDARRGPVARSGPSGFGCAPAGRPGLQHRLGFDLGPDERRPARPVQLHDRRHGGNRRRDGPGDEPRRLATAGRPGVRGPGASLVVGGVQLRLESLVPGDHAGPRHAPRNRSGGFSRSQRAISAGPGRARPRPAPLDPSARDPAGPGLVLPGRARLLPAGRVLPGDLQQPADAADLCFCGRPARGGLGVRR